MLLAGLVQPRLVLERSACLGFQGRYLALCPLHAGFQFHNLLVDTGNDVAEAGHNPGRVDLVCLVLVNVVFAGGALQFHAHNAGGSAVEVDLEAAQGADAGLVLLAGFQEPRHFEYEFLTSVLALVVLNPLDGGGEHRLAILAYRGVLLAQGDILLDVGNRLWSGSNYPLVGAYGVLDAPLLPGVRSLKAGQLADFGPEFEFLQDQRIAGGGRLHFGRAGRRPCNVLHFPAFHRAGAYLLDKPGLALDGLPHPGIVGLLGRVAVDADLEVFGIGVAQLVALPDDPAFALLQV